MSTTDPTPTPDTRQVEHEAHAEYIAGTLPRSEYIATIARLHAERSLRFNLRPCCCLACTESPVA